MALNLEQKKAVVAEVADAAKAAVAVVAAEYAGLTVGQMTELRVKARGRERLSQGGQEYFDAQSCRRHRVRVHAGKADRTSPVCLQHERSRCGRSAG